MTRERQQEEDFDSDSKGEDDQETYRVPDSNQARPRCSRAPPARNLPAGRGRRRGALRLYFHVPGVKGGSLGLELRAPPASDTGAGAGACTPTSRSPSRGADGAAAEAAAGFLNLSYGGGGGQKGSPLCSGLRGSKVVLSVPADRDRARSPKARRVQVAGRGDLPLLGGREEGDGANMRKRAAVEEKKGVQGSDGVFFV